MREYEHKLTPAEVKRNVHGPMYQYDFNDVDQGPLEGRFGLSKIEHNMCKETPIYRADVSIDKPFIPNF